MKNTGAKVKLPPHVVLIILIPLVLVLMMLNTGWIQGILPAVTVYGRSYSALEFRYYFYNAYYDYVNEHAEELEELNLDVTKTLKDQTYDGERTWQDYFQDAALEKMEEVTLLLEAAAEAGFSAEDEVGAACDERLEKLRQYCIDTGLSSLEDYFTAYYETGMTQERYLELYADQTVARLYREERAEQSVPTEDEVERRAASLGTSAVPTAPVSLACFEAAADRVSGEPEQRQWDNARTLAETFLERWEQDGGGTELFCAMTVTYVQAAQGPEDGVWNDMEAEALEPDVAQWCFAPERKEGDTALLSGETGWWVVCYLQEGEDARLRQARQELQQEQYEQWCSQRQNGRTTVIHALGMTLAL